MAAVVEIGDKISIVASAKPEQGYLLLSQLINDRVEKLRHKESLDSINQHKLSTMFLNIVKAVNDLEEKGFKI